MTLHQQHLLITPNALHRELPISSETIVFVNQSRQIINQILQGKDDRLLVIVGPCSIHDPEAALAYGDLLRHAIKQFSEELYIVMRVYFEKPRTTVGWKGFISDPFLNGSFDINTGLRLSRKLLLDLSALEIPCGTEFLDTHIPSYLSDLISWTAIGARTSASQIHRELASGLSMPVGFKNSVDGNIKIAIDAVTVAARPQPMLGINDEGSPVIIHTSGNPFCHIILRGGDHGSNYELKYVNAAEQLLKTANLPPSLLIDCSHGNSMRNYRQQEQVINIVIDHIHNGIYTIKGLMIESNLIAGKQTLTSPKSLIYGQSITDGCLAWNDTLPLLEKLAVAKRQMRKIKNNLREELYEL